MNRLFLQYIQEKQKNNFEMISFKNSMRKNCWQNPLSIVESEVVSTEVVSSPPVNPTPQPFDGWPILIVPQDGPFGKPLPGPYKPSVFEPDYGGGNVYDGPSVFDPVDPDRDEDGIPDSIDPDVIPFEDQDHDGDGIPNFMDPDSAYYNPNGGRIVLAGQTDDNGDGIPDGIQDNNGNGRPDMYDDDDNDGIYNYQDPDHRLYNDGYTDGWDDDNDGINDFYDTHPNDSDNDGEPNGEDIDQDNDGVPDRYDRDIDNDGIPNMEDDTPYGGSEGEIPWGVQDFDGDGIPNSEDSSPFGNFGQNGNPQGL